MPQTINRHPRHRPDPLRNINPRNRKRRIPILHRLFPHLKVRRPSKPHLIPVLSRPKSFVRNFLLRHHSARDVEGGDGDVTVDWLLDADVEASVVEAVELDVGDFGADLDGGGDEVGIGAVDDVVGRGGGVGLEKGGAVCEVVG
jgi:hypothetical protein